MLRYVMLAVIADGGPMHGYALMKAFAARSGVRLSIGNVYRELQRLRADGLIVPVSNPAGADPRRAPYAITEKGRAALGQWLATPAKSFVHDSIDRLYYRLALLSDGDAERAGTFLSDLEAELSMHNRSAEQQRAAAGGMLSILLGRRTKHLAADIQMLGEIRAALSARPTRRAAKAAPPTSRTNGPVGSDAHAAPATALPPSGSRQQRVARR